MKTTLLALLLLTSCASHSLADCNPTWLGGSWYVGDADSAVVVEQGYNLTSTMGYDYHQGRLYGHCHLCFEVADVRASDAYMIQGAPAGVPIPIHVELRTGVSSDHRCGGFSDCPGMEVVGERLSIYSSESGDSVDCRCLIGQQSVGIDLVVTPDQEFVVGYYLEMSRGPTPFYEFAEEATVHFSGIPAGAQLVSCHGVNDAAVPTKPTSWGQLKASYR